MKHILLLFLCGLFCCAGKQPNAEEIRRSRITQELIVAMNREGIEDPIMWAKVSRLETGHFSSSLWRHHNSYFGMNCRTSAPTSQSKCVWSAKDGWKASYSNMDSSVKDLKYRLEYYPRMTWRRVVSDGRVYEYHESTEAYIVRTKWNVNAHYMSIVKGIRL